MKRAGLRQVGALKTARECLLPEYEPHSSYTPLAGEGELWAERLEVDAVPIDYPVGDTHPEHCTFPEWLNLLKSKSFLQKIAEEERAAEAFSDISRISVG